MDEEMIKFRREFGARVREKRVEANMTQAELAQALGYSEENGKSIISKIENGKVEPPISRLFVFAKVLHTSFVYLMGWDKLIRMDEKDAAMRTWMTEEEGIMLVMFRQLNSSGKQAALSMLKGMTLNKEFMSRNEKDTSSKAG